MAIDRIIFVPPKLQKHAYEDRPLPLGPEQTISAPHMHATALSVLTPALTEGARVLDVGVGSGYMLSVMAEMVGESGRCAGIDIVPSIVELARENIRRQGTGLAARALEQKRLFLGAVDGWGGLELKAPFDAIHVGAAATSIPEKLVEQLAAGGRMVIPVGPIHGVQELLEVRRDAKTMKVCADLRWCLQTVVANTRCKHSLQMLVANARCKQSLQTVVAICKHRNQDDTLGIVGTLGIISARGGASIECPPARLVFCTGFDRSPEHGRTLRANAVVKLKPSASEQSPPRALS